MNQVLKIEGVLKGYYAYIHNYSNIHKQHFLDFINQYQSNQQSDLEKLLKGYYLQIKNVSSHRFPGIKKYEGQLSLRVLCVLLFLLILFLSAFVAVAVKNTYINGVNLINPSRLSYFIIAFSSTFFLFVVSFLYTFYSIEIRDLTIQSNSEDQKAKIIFKFFFLRILFNLLLFMINIGIMLIIFQPVITKISLIIIVFGILVLSFVNIFIPFLSYLIHSCGNEIRKIKEYKDELEKEYNKNKGYKYNVSELLNFISFCNQQINIVVQDFTHNVLLKVTIITPLVISILATVIAIVNK